MMQSTSASQLLMQNMPVSQPTGQTTASALQPTLQQQTATLVHPVTPIEVLVSRSRHQGGVNWVFHDFITRGVWHVNVPYVRLVAQQSFNQSASQPVATSGMVLYQQPSSQIAQHAPQIASANQPTAPTLTQIASAAHPMAPASPQLVQVPSQQIPIANQQIDWSAKIAEVIWRAVWFKAKAAIYHVEDSISTCLCSASLPTQV